MPRAVLIVMDSVGIGGAPDAADFGDEGANTLGHIHSACAQGAAEEGRSGPLLMPNLWSLGLGQAAGLGGAASGLYGRATEVSPGKDTPTGHWELAGVPVPWDWHFFPDTTPCFPPELVARVKQLAGTDGVLGDCHASGTQIIAQLGAQHIKSGWPICYTSTDSVFQIAAHETHFGLDRLLALCEALAPDLHKMNVGRVIARPFIGELGAFKRTANRRDYAVAPPAPTLCDWAHMAGRKVYGVGKIGDIFSMRGIIEVRKGEDRRLMEHLIDFAGSAEDGAFIFANFVEFDSLYGHRRDVSGYARHLEWFDAQLPRLFDVLRDEDLVIFTADHGNDPTWAGTDHTREQVPVVAHGSYSGDIGQVGFVDVAASIAAHLGIRYGGEGQSFL